jgi:DNA ligase (NAD+)
MTTNKILISNFLKSLTKLNKESLNEIKGIGPKISDNLINFLESENYNTLIDKFEKLERLENSNDQNKYQISQTSFSQTETKNTKTICITGTFSQTRDEIKQILEQNGYKFTNVINSQTNYLLCGEKAGSKLKQAEKLKTPVYYSLTDFLDAT